MSKFARVVQNIAVDISTDPNRDFHPIIAAEFIKVSDQVDRGWVLAKGKWSPPPEPEPYEPVFNTELPTPVEK